MSMHQVQITQETFARLQSHAVPLVDTIETVINRALDALEGEGKPASKPSKGGFDPSAPPSLSFTTVRSATVAGIKQQANETYWNSVLINAVKFAAKKGLSPTQIAELVVVNNVVGEKDSNGYKYIKEAGISVQGQDANAAWKAIYHLATKIEMEVEISFVWQSNPKAAFPGQTGKLTILN